MDIEDISGIVLDVLQEVQEMSGRGWAIPDAGGNLIGNLEGFDSLCAIEATAFIEEKVGLNETGIESLFVSEDGNHALSLVEVSQRVHVLLGTSELK